MADERTDEQLNEALVKGDSRAGPALYDRYFGRVRGYFINKVADPAAWDDLTQQTFEIAFTQPQKFRGEAPYGSWLFGIARNFLLGHLRRAKQRATRQDDAIEEIEDVPVANLGLGQSTLMAKYAELQRLIDMLRRIPSKNQQAFEMYYWQGMSAGEIGRVCECSEGTVRGRLRLAREQLEALGIAADSFEDLARRVKRQVLGDDEA